MHLARKLGGREVFCLASGAMISSGLFVLPGLAFSQAGPGVVLAYALAAVMVIPALLSQAELATAMPRSGGSYFFIERSMGALPGTLAGLANWLSISLKAAFALIGIGACTRLLWPDASDWAVKAVAIGGTGVFTALNLVSVKGVGRLQLVLVAALLIILVMFAYFGLPAIDPGRFRGFGEAGATSILATAAMVFISFGGLTKAASVAEEVRRPGRNIPLGMFSAAAVVTVLYVATVAVMVGVMEPEKLAGNLTPASHAALIVLGTPGEALVTVGAILAFVTTANSGILAASRAPLAMSRDGLLPAGLQKVSRRFGTPWASIVATGAIIATTIALLSIPDLVKAASTVMLILFMLVNAAVLIMRRSGLQNYRPLYRAPGYPYLQYVGIVLYLILAASMGTVPILMVGGFGLASVGWYLVYVRQRTTRESALVYMVKNLVSRKVYRGGLEEELREIALHRDQVIHDRFDRLIRQCAILDLPGTLRTDELFAHMADALTDRLGIDPKDLREAFDQREALTSTVIQPGLAIPHIIVEGREKFEIALVRCRDGIVFPGHDRLVKIVFALVGSDDQRDYHLRALMAIAHIVGEHDFVRRWLAATGAESLRDLILLSSRKREAAEIKR